MAQNSSLYILLHVHSLLGNVLINKFPRREILGKQSVAMLRNNKEGCVFYVVRATPNAVNGPMNSQSDTWHVFSVGSVPTIIRGSRITEKANRCGGVVEYLHRSPASSRRRWKVSLKSGTVKYGREFQGTRTRERLRWQGPEAFLNDSRQRVGF
jgi:hypothetical protein